MVWFFDEAVFGQTTSARVWHKIGLRNIVAKQGKGPRVHMSVAACSEQDLAFSMIYSKADTLTTGDFLQRLSETLPPNKHIALILDNASYHKSEKLIIPSNITLIFLPPYSPELNPVEQIWWYLRQYYTANYCFKSLDDAFDICSDAWQAFIAQAGRVQSLCFRGWVALQ